MKGFVFGIRFLGLIPITGPVRDFIWLKHKEQKRYKETLKRFENMHMNAGIFEFRLGITPEPRFLRRYHRRHSQDDIINARDEDFFQEFSPSDLINFRAEELKIPRDCEARASSGLIIFEIESISRNITVIAVIFVKLEWLVEGNDLR